MKYVVGYQLPYIHHVEVGIKASSPDQAIERARALFDDAAIWDDTPETPLLVDDFYEDEAAGAALSFTIEKTIEACGRFPDPDLSVKRLRADEKARAAARALIAAYERGEANGGSIEWADIDAAYELALSSRL